MYEMGHRRGVYVKAYVMTYVMGKGIWEKGRRYKGMKGEKCKFEYYRLR